MPVFLMISGFLLLDPRRGLDLAKVRRYIRRMVAVLATFGFGYCLLETLAADGLSDPLGSLWTAALALVQGKCWDHMWYVYALIGLYLLTPMFRAFTATVDQRTMDFTLCALFLLTVAVPFVNSVTGLELEGFLPISSYCVFFYLTGYAIKKNGFDRRLAYGLFIGGLAGSMLTLYFGMNGEGAPNCGGSLFAACYSIGLFALAQDSAFLEGLTQNRLLRSFAKHSFGIYLMHALFINVIYKVLFLFPGMLPFLIGEAVFTVVCFLGAWLASVVLCRLKFFRWILL